MRIYHTILLAASTMLTPVAVLAQDSFDTTVTLGFSKGTFENEDYDTASLGLFSELMFSNGFGLETALGFSRNYNDFADVDLTSFGVAPTFVIGRGYKVGAYVSRSTFDDGVDDISVDGRGIILGFETSSVDIEGYYGTTDFDPELVGVDVKDMGANIAYDVSTQLTLGAGMARTRIEVSGETVDADGFGVAASYDVNPDFQIFGGLQRIKLDEPGYELSGTTIGLGVGYNLPEMSGVRPNISLELVHNQVDYGSTTDDGNEVRFGLTIPFGNASSTPQGSVAANVLNGTRSNLSPVILAVF